jgi:hypothetical protein
VQSGKALTKKGHNVSPSTDFLGENFFPRSKSSSSLKEDVVTIMVYNVNEIFDILNTLGWD